MKFTLEIKCDNDAFFPEPDYEICRILNHIANNFPCYSRDIEYLIKDINGNTVGEFCLSVEDEQ